MALIEREPLVPCTPDDIKALFPCIICVDSEKFRWAALVYLLWRIVYGANATFSADALNAAAACFKCVKSDEELMQLVINLLVKYAIYADVVPEDTSPAVDAGCLMCEDVLTLKQEAVALFCGWLNELATPN